MKRPLVSLVALLAALSLAAAAAAVPDEPSAKPLRAVAGEFIVGFVPGVSEEDRAQIVKRVKGVKRKRLNKIDAWLIKGDEFELVTARKILGADPRVRFVEPNYVLSTAAVPNDPSLTRLWGLVNTGQTVEGVAGTPDADIDADVAWNSTTGSDSVVVAVIDTGVAFGHPDLAAGEWRNPDEVVDGVDNDRNGYVDDIRGWDFASNDNNPNDDNEHGTHVAGTIGARGNNGTGVVGVNWRVKIMALKFLDASGGGTLADAILAIEYATREGADVMNNSWGGGGYSQALADAIEAAEAAGVLFVAAAGNETANNDSDPAYPASYDITNVVSVAATDNRDRLADFSNWGRNSVHIGAPGVEVYSTVPPSGYDSFSGTSMATPHVAGAAALVLARDPAATAVGIKALLTSTGDQISSLAGKTTSGARLNVGNAVACTNAPQLLVDKPAQTFTVGRGAPIEVGVIGTNCAHPAGATVTLKANGSSVPLTARGDGYYSGTVTPSSLGTLTLDVAVTVGASTKTARLTGDVVDNYRAENTAYSWIDASIGGKKLALAVDDGYVTEPLPSAFRYYGTSFSSVRVSSNGYLVFGSDSASAYRGSVFPTSDPPNNVVACLWDDLNPRVGGGVYTKAVGSDFVIQWKDVPHYAVAGDVSFEAILKSNGDIVCQYQDVIVGFSDYDKGAAAAIGGENANGTIGYQYGFNQSVLSNGQAIRFTSGASTPGDTTPPAAPTGLAAVPGNGTVALDWANNGESDLDGYRVYRDGALVASPASSAYTVTGLTNGTSYVFRVTALDTSGNESAAAEISATPRASRAKTLLPKAIVGVAGSLGGGGLSSLRTNDNSYVVWNSAGGVADYYARTTVGSTVRARLNGITFAFDGQVTASAPALELYVYNFATAAWERIFGPQTGVTADLAVTWGAPQPTNYVSSAGEIRLRVRATGTGSFKTRTDQVTFTVSY